LLGIPARGRRAEVVTPYAGAAYRAVRPTRGKNTPDRVVDFWQVMLAFDTAIC